MEHRTWIKRNRVEVEETENNAAVENSSDTSMESEYNYNSTVSSPFPRRDDDSSEKKKEISVLFCKETILGI